MAKSDKEIMGDSIDALIYENEKLIEKVKELKHAKEEASEVTSENIELRRQIETLNNLLRDYKCPKDDRYKEYFGDDWSYWPKRGTDGHPYTWPYAPGVGDWPPGPQVGDWPPQPCLPNFPYWSVVPPYWYYPYYPYNNYVTVSSNTTDSKEEK